MKNFIKNYLRKWLEIPDEKAIDFEDLLLSTRKDVRALVKSAFEEAFLPDVTFKYASLWEDGERLYGTLDDAVRRLALRTIKEETEKKIDSIVTPEKFIDEIVERIKIKQL